MYYLEELELDELDEVDDAVTAVELPELEEAVEPRMFEIPMEGTDIAGMLMLSGLLVSSLSPSPPKIPSLRETFRKLR